MKFIADNFYSYMSSFHKDLQLFKNTVTAKMINTGYSKGLSMDRQGVLPVLQADCDLGCGVSGQTNDTEYSPKISMKYYHKSLI